MIFLRSDRDPIPDKQSYYDWTSYIGGKEGLWSAANYFETKEELIEAFTNKTRATAELLEKLIVHTKRGWQIATPPNTLFGWVADIPMEHFYFQPGGYLQVWEGYPVGDSLYFSIVDKSIMTDGELFVPIKMLYCYKIPDNFLKTSALIDWARTGTFSINPFTQKAAALTRFLQAETVTFEDKLKSTAKYWNDRRFFEPYDEEVIKYFMSYTQDRTLYHIEPKEFQRAKKFTENNKIGDAEERLWPFLNNPDRDVWYISEEAAMAGWQRISQGKYLGVLYSTTITHPIQYLCCPLCDLPQETQQLFNDSQDKYLISALYSKGTYKLEKFVGDWETVLSPEVQSIPIWVLDEIKRYNQSAGRMLDTRVSEYFKPFLPTSPTILYRGLGFDIVQMRQILRKFKLTPTVGERSVYETGKYQSWSSSQNVAKEFMGRFMGGFGGAILDEGSLGLLFKTTVSPEMIAVPIGKLPAPVRAYLQFDQDEYILKPGSYPVELVDIMGNWTNEVDLSKIVKETAQSLAQQFNCKLERNWNKTPGFALGFVNSPLAHDRWYPNIQVFVENNLEVNVDSNIGRGKQLAEKKERFSTLQELVDYIQNGLKVYIQSIVDPLKDQLAAEKLRLFLLGDNYDRLQ